MSSRNALPGFNLSLGYTLTWLSLIVLIPLAAVFIKTAELTLEQFWGRFRRHASSLPTN